jgi:hypothetical protein
MFAANRKKYPTISKLNDVVEELAVKHGDDVVVVVTVVVVEVVVVVAIIYDQDLVY